MLAANVCASDFLKAHQHPVLYRIHAGPSAEKLTKLRDFMKEFGFTLEGGDTPHAKDYSKLLNRIKGRPDEQLLQTVLLRSMQQAVYSPDNVGHFGLAYESYTHFTSPIRRYPDLLVHRAIKAVLENKKYKAGDWAELGMHCSLTERRADDATRDVDAWLKCYYMQDKVGESFDGTVAGVTSFGLFVALDGVYVDTGGRDRDPAQHAGALETLAALQAAFPSKLVGFHVDPLPPFSWSRVALYNELCSVNGTAAAELSPALLAYLASGWPAWT